MANKYWYGGSPNHLGEWDYDTSVTDTIDNAAAVDKGGGLVGIPITGHPYAADDSVVIDGTSNYDGTYIIVSETANEIVITATYAAETFAGTETATATSNWKLVSTGADTAKPAAADVIYFNGRAYDDATTGKKQSADTNIDGTGTGTPDLAGLYVSADFTGDIGTSSEYLELEADGDDIVIEGGGTVYLKLSAGVGADSDCGKLVLNSSNTTLYIASLENDGGNVGLFAEVNVFAGKLYLDANTAITKLTTTNRQVTVYGSSGITNAKTSTDCNVYLIEGTVYWQSDIATLELYGGVFYWGQAGMTEIATATIALLKSYTGATFVWQLAATTNSIINQFILYGGRLSAATSTNSGYNKQIGSGVGEISELWGGATADLNNNNRNLSIGASTKIEAFGGTLIPPAGALIDW